MNYYRKYRPQTVAELDLVPVRQAFERIRRSGNFVQAYLFSGPKGTGKTSAARILAKMVNCEQNRHQLPVTSNQKLEEPCGECESCRAIVSGSSLAVVEMDAASNRGIDEIRALKEKVYLSPGEAPYAVYVIDEVHMLTTEAFNALLKTLEEPPPHAIFVLCTTEKQKVPETIISRCSEIGFKQASPEEVKLSLSKAVRGEAIEIEEAALTALSERVEGSFRDGMKLLEGLNQTGGRISLAQVDEATGHSNLYQPAKLIEALSIRDLPAFLKELGSRLANGAEISILGRRLVEQLRQEMIGMAMTGKAGLPEFTYKLNLTDKMIKAMGQMKTSPIPELPLEIAAGEWCLEKETPKVQEIHEEVEVQRVPEVQKVQEAKEGLQSAVVSLAEVKAKWSELMKKVKPHNHSLEALLRSARPLDLAGNNLRIEVFYSFHKEQLEQDRHLKVLESVAREVWGSGFKLKFVLGAKARKAATAASPAIANVTGEVADEKIAEAAEEIFG